VSSNAGDLTARARIRDAAIRLFAEKGIGAASIRDIAQEAGVSSGLLRHHFGSKEGLRDACDEYAMGQATAIGTRFIEFGLLSRLTPEILLLQRYLVRSAMDGSPAGNTLFDQMIEYGFRWLDSTDLKVPDATAYIAVLCAMKMSMFTMRDQLSRVLGEDVGEPAGWIRMLQASIEIFAHPLVPPELAEQAREALARFETPEEFS
jgi:TetR/AcrR family transcriptional regulator, regulator of cefoperazone and chloramphenicol sensitivity